jgi:hypothetical protein
VPDPPQQAQDAYQDLDGMMNDNCISRPTMIRFPDPA